MVSALTLHMDGDGPGPIMVQFDKHDFLPLAAQEMAIAYDHRHASREDERLRMGVTVDTLIALTLAIDAAKMRISSACRIVHITDVIVSIVSFRGGEAIKDCTHISIVDGWPADEILLILIDPHASRRMHRLDDSEPFPDTRFPDDVLNFPGYGNKLKSSRSLDIKASCERGKRHE